MLKAPETLKDAIAESLWQVRERAEQRGDSHIQLPSDESSGFFEHCIRESLRIKGKMVLPKARWLNDPLDSLMSENSGEDYTVP